MNKLIVLALVVLCVGSEAKRFTKCSVVHELRKQGFDENLMRNWVCLIQNESNFLTSATNTNRNGSKDYGLFQINDRYWCSKGSSPGKDCNVKCSDLLTEDITKAAKCAKKIYKRHGFNAWYGWKNHCQGSLPDISSC